MIAKFHESLSEQSVHLRYFQALQLQQRIAHERLIRICFIDYSREIALVAEHRDPTTHEPEILAVGRLIKIHGTDIAEFAVLVTDKAQGKGLGSELLRRLLQVGRDERLSRIRAEILPENVPMQRVSERLGFRLRHDVEERIVKAEIDLTG